MNPTTELLLRLNGIQPAFGFEFGINRWHQSVLGNLRLVDKWRPKRAYMIHYSGYEDREYPQEPVHGPLSQQQLRRVAGGRDIQAAEHGMILGDNVPWPG
jgi:hypothetical protein